MVNAVNARDIAIIWSCHATEHYPQGWIEPPEAKYERTLFNLWSGEKLIRYDCCVRFWEPPGTSAIRWWKPPMSPINNEREWWELPQDVTIYTANRAMLHKYPICPIRITWKEREIALRGSLAILPRGVRFSL